jgi:hypothetical protein
LMCLLVRVFTTICIAECELVELAIGPRQLFKIPCFPSNS